MKALILRSPGCVEWVEAPVPEIHPDYLLVKTGASTLCTSDLNDIRENPFHIPLPVGLGHEAAGTVAAVGAAVSGFHPGDRVATHPVHPCGQCTACRGGMEHLCLDMGHFGINLPGTFADYYIVRQDRARLIPETVDFPLAALAEPVSVCLEALAQAKLNPGGSLLIIGDGPFGVMMSRLAQAFGLGRVVIAGYFPFRLSNARADVRLNTRDLVDPVQAMRDAVPGGLYDAAILAVGSKQALAEGLRCLKPKGRMVVFSALPCDTPVDLFWVHLKELEILGACNDANRFDAAVRMLSDPALGLEDLITHRFPLADYQRAIALADTGKAEALKVAFIF